MPATKAPAKTNTLGLIYAGLITLSIFLAYPLVLLLPQGLPAKKQWFIGLFSHEDLVYNGFAFKLPILAFLSCLGLAYLLSRHWNFKPGSKTLLIPAGLFLLFTTLSTLTHHSSPFQFANRAAFVIIPLVSALLLISKKASTNKKFFARLFGTYWLISVIHALCFLLHHNSTSVAIPGLVGNKNWFIASLLATTPWAVLFFRPLIFRFLKPIKGSSRVGSAYLISFAFTWSISLLALIQNQSRAAWLAFALLIFYAMQRAASKKFKKIIFIFSFVAILGSSFYGVKNYDRLTHNELHPTLWKGTLKMISSAPTLGAAGPGQFEARFPSHRLQEQLILPIAASHTAHPHNEFLLFAAEIGLPGALALLIFILFIWKVRDQANNTASQSIILLSICACFDRALDQQVIALIFLLNLGLLLSPYLRSQMQENKANSIVKMNQVFSLIIILGALFISFRSAKGSWYYRQGLIAESRTLNTKDDNLKREYRKRSYDLFIKAVSFDHNNIIYNYHAADSGLKAIINTQQVAPYLKTVLRLGPDFIHINRFKAYYYELVARLQNTPANKKASLKRARDANKREEVLYAPQLDTLSDCLLFYLRNNLFHDAINLQQRFAKESLRIATHLHQDQLGNLLNDWHNKILNKQFDQAITVANKIRAGVKGLNYIDTMFNSSAPQNLKKARLIKGKTFGNADSLYWDELIQLRKFIGQSSVGKETVDKILSSIKLVPGRQSQSITEVLKTKRATSQSLAALLALTANIQSKRSLILHDKKSFSNWLCLMEAPGGFLLISPTQRSTKVISPSTWQALFSKDQLNAFCFAHPQSFFSANSFLISLYNSHFATHSISALTPSLNWKLSNAIFSTKNKLHFYAAPFNSLPQQINKFQAP